MHGRVSTFGDRRRAKEDAVRAHSETHAPCTDEQHSVYIKSAMTELRYRSDDLILGDLPILCRKSSCKYSHKITTGTQHRYLVPTMSLSIFTVLENVLVLESWFTKVCTPEPAFEHLS